MKTGAVERERFLLDLFWRPEVDLDNSFFILV